MKVNIQERCVICLERVVGLTVSTTYCGAFVVVAMTVKAKANNGLVATILEKALNQELQKAGGKLEIFR